MKRSTQNHLGVMFGLAWVVAMLISPADPQTSLIITAILIAFAGYGIFVGLRVERELTTNCSQENGEDGRDTSPNEQQASNASQSIHEEQGPWAIASRAFTYVNRIAQHINKPSTWIHLVALLCLTYLVAMALLPGCPLWNYIHAAAFLAFATYGFFIGTRIARDKIRGSSTEVSRDAVARDTNETPPNEL